MSPVVSLADASSDVCATGLAAVLVIAIIVFVVVVVDTEYARKVRRRAERAEQPRAHGEHALPRAVVRPRRS